MKETVLQVDGKKRCERDAREGRVSRQIRTSMDAQVRWILADRGCPVHKGTDAHMKDGGGLIRG